MADKQYNTFKEFWPFYLREHSDLSNRALHFIGSAGALVCFGCAAYFQQPWYILAALFTGYGFAWIGHFFLEKNRPASFRYPFKSFAADWVMFFCILTFQIGKQLKKAHEIQAQEAA